MSDSSNPRKRYLSLLSLIIDVCFYFFSSESSISCQYEPLVSDELSIHSKPAAVRSALLLVDFALKNER